MNESARDVNRCAETASTGGDRASAVCFTQMSAEDSGDRAGEELEVWVFFPGMSQRV